MSSWYQPTQENPKFSWGTTEGWKLDKGPKAQALGSRIRKVFCMNIKGLVSNILPSIETKQVDPAGKTIKSDMTHDRDANGQETYQQQGDSEHREPMSDEQLDRSLEHLRNLSAVKEHKWTVHLEVEALGKFVLIKDNLGNVIRRIPEKDLWSLPSDDSPKGQLLKRSA